MIRCAHCRKICEPVALSWYMASEDRTHQFCSSWHWLRYTVTIWRGPSQWGWWRR
jgi:hypothetical protein